MATLNPALDKKDVLINGVMGLCGESGEAIDIVKKWLMQGHEPDKEHLVRELGDVAWYLAEAATALDGPQFYRAGGSAGAASRELLIQKGIAEKASIPCGKLILIVKSAHFYLRNREKVLAIIDKER